MQRMNRYGFPCATAREHVKRRYGFQTGDIVCVTLAGKYAGTYVARITECNKPHRYGLKPIRKPELRLSNGVPGRMKIVQRADGYTYTYEKERPIANPPTSRQNSL